MAQLTPMASAPPAGRVFATALEPRLTTAASRSRIDGSTEQIMIQVAAMLATAAATTSSTCAHVIAPMLDCTLRYDAKCGTAKSNMAATIITDTAVRTNSRPGRGRAITGGAVPRSGRVFETAGRSGGGTLGGGEPASG